MEKNKRENLSELIGEFCSKMQKILNHVADRPKGAYQNMLTFQLMKEEKLFKLLCKIIEIARQRKLLKPEDLPCIPPQDVLNGYRKLVEQYEKFLKRATDLNKLESAYDGIRIPLWLKIQRKHNDLGVTLIKLAAAKEAYKKVWSTLQA